MQSYWQQEEHQEREGGENSARSNSKVQRSFDLSSRKMPDYSYLERVHRSDQVEAISAEYFAQLLAFLHIFLQ
ncbi:unnamed protein product, partial [Amoebophrya sp. A25]|eukprot:GSA25T00016838001.1